MSLQICGKSLSYASSTEPNILVSKSVVSSDILVILLPVDLLKRLFWAFMVSLINFFISSVLKLSCSSFKAVISSVESFFFAGL
ncbi:hypothetical protein [Clostridium kluyveri]|uniref:Uncharacterized protein n=1 Tax=Clostridium kluyveri (strain NBRC 12016) TaxID=583346 RepID=B9E0Q8_CLOK1|nr:hypothetical protein [Clostridium kluyveri]BAH06083.1 hypothetical protein CKR_1032 [Clostridium kluyveri NBRC 12016]